jgi:peroxiredoxin
VIRLLPLLLLLGCAHSPSPASVARASRVPPPVALAPQMLPPVALATLDGQPAQLVTVAAGRPALVSLWATWCEACAGEFDALARLDAAARSQGAAVIAVAVGEPRATVADFVRRRGLPYAQLVDEQFRLADALGQSRVPATLVLDRAGRIVYRGGAFDDAALAALRAQLPTQATR